MIRLSRRARRVIERQGGCLWGLGEEPRVIEGQGEWLWGWGVRPCEGRTKVLVIGLAFDDAPDDIYRVFRQATMRRERPP